MNTRTLAIMAGTSTIAIYAIQFVAIRFSVGNHSETGLTPLDLTTLRVVTSSLFLLLFLRKKHFLEIAKINLKTIVVLVLIAGAPYPFLINLGATFSPASHAATLLPPSIAFFSFIIGAIWFRTPLSARSFASLLPIVAGIVAISVHSISNAKGAITGDLIFFAIGSMFAYFTLTVRKLEIDPLAMTAGLAIGSLPIIFAAQYIFPSNLATADISEVLAQILIQGVFSGSITLFLTIYCARQLGAQTASLFLIGIPTVTTILGSVVLNETPTNLEILAIFLMAVGCGFPVLESVYRRFATPQQSKV